MKNTLNNVIVLCSIAVASFFGYRYFSLTRRESTLTLYGNIDIRQVNLGARVGGKLAVMHYEEGDRVKAGTVLAALDKQPYLAKYRQAQAKLEQATVDKQNADRYFQRNATLCKKQTLSPQECDNITTKKATAQAAFNYAKALVAEAETAYKDTQIYAPSDGIILIRIQEVGSILGAGTPVYTLSLSGAMWARTYIREADLGKITLGSPVQIYTDSSSKVYKGHVGFISPVAEFTPKTIETESLRSDLVYRIRIIIDDADDYLKQGMPITIKVQ